MRSRSGLRRCVATVPWCGRHSQRGGRLNSPCLAGTTDYERRRLRRSPEPNRRAFGLMHPTTGPAKIRRRPCSSAFLTPAFRLLIDLALTPSRRQGRATDTDGPRLHLDTFGVSTYWRYAWRIQPAGATPSGLTTLSRDSLPHSQIVAARRGLGIACR